MDEEVLISPCDGKVSVYPICEKGKFEIKHTAYTAEQLLQDAHLAKHYYGGWIYILRLTVDDYHRYCYVADGCEVFAEEDKKESFIQLIRWRMMPVRFTK